MFIILYVICTPQAFLSCWMKSAQIMQLNTVLCPNLVFSRYRVLHQLTSFHTIPVSGDKQWHDDAGTTLQQHALIAYEGHGLQNKGSVHGHIHVVFSCG